MGCALGKIGKQVSTGGIMMDKQWTLEELEQLVGKEQLEKLFLEHYLELIGKDNQHIKLVDGLKLEDLME